MIEFFQINAFSSKPFCGNPAIVCPLKEWVDDAMMQKIAAENNVTTAFFVGENGRYDIRWFTPSCEIEGICGHGTLAAGYVVLCELGISIDEVSFSSNAGELLVRTTHEEGLVLDLPALVPEPCSISPASIEAFGHPVEATLGALDFIAVFESEKKVADFDPEAAALINLPRRAVIITAAGDDCDFVSRWFAPKMGEREDAGITGSAHCSLAPYWAGRLGKPMLNARQLSPRGGAIDCKVRADRVELFTTAVKYMHGHLQT